MKRFVIAMFLTILVIMAGAVGNNYVSSMQQDAAISQILPGENAIMERTFLQSNAGTFVTLLQGVLLVLIWVPAFRQKKEDKHEENNT